MHGTSAYFLERARFERRLSLIISIVATAFLAIQIALIVPRFRAALVKNVPVLDPKRWGFEGPEQFVRRIELQSSGGGGASTAPVVTYRPLQALKGGRPARPSSRLPNATPEPRRVGSGPGDSPEDLLTRARALYREAPVIQSEDLIIEHLVRPSYPEEAREKDIEGRVAVIALVDTSGRVVRVDMMSTSGEAQLDRAATDAVWQCRFKPYVHGGKVQEVYAMFRFSFRIY